MVIYVCNECKTSFETDDFAACPSCDSYNIRKVHFKVSTENLEEEEENFTCENLPIEHHQIHHIFTARPKNSRFNVRTPEMNSILRQALTIAIETLGTDLEQLGSRNIVVSCNKIIGIDANERIESSDIMLQISHSGFHGYPIGPLRAAQGIRKQKNIVIMLNL